MTTRRNKTHPVAPNRLKRNFEADCPNKVWLSDITYIWTEQGWPYLAVMMDLYSRRIFAWAMSDRITSELMMKALRMALKQREVQLGLIHHSEQGSQYTDSRYQQLFKDWRIQAGVKGVGAWYDNAPVESFFATLKTERVRRRAYRTRAEARVDIFSYIEDFCNRRRIHTALGSVSPLAYEQSCHDGAGVP